jgi:iron(III) transport system substrate-binding protein
MRRLLLVLALFSAFACARPGGDGAETDNDTPDGGTVTIYSGREEELVAPIIERFEQDTGITADVHYGDTAELAAQLIEEGDNSRADVFWAQDAGALGAVAKFGSFDELDDEILDKVPAGFRSPEGLWVGTSGRARVLVYNTEEVEEADLPGSVLDLTDEEWQGKVGWAPTNGSFQAFVTAMRLVEGDDETKAWLEAMSDNDTQPYDGNSAIVQAVASGEIAVGLVNHYYVLEMGAEDAEIKEKVKNHFFEGGDVGSLVNAAGVGILEGAENDDEAQEFVEYLLSRTGAEYFDEEVYEYPLVEGLETPKGLPELDEIEQPDIDLSDLEDLEGTLKLMRSAGLI